MAGRAHTDATSCTAQWALGARAPGHTRHPRTALSRGASAVRPPVPPPEGQLGPGAGHGFPGGQAVDPSLWSAVLHPGGADRLAPSALARWKPPFGPVLTSTSTPDKGLGLRDTQAARSWRGADGQWADPSDCPATHLHFHLSSTYCVLAPVRDPGMQHEPNRPADAILEP